MDDYEFTWDLSDIIFIIITIILIITYNCDHKNTVGTHTLGRCHMGLICLQDLTMAF
jgi:hypothetical protein